MNDSAQRDDAATPPHGPGHGPASGPGAGGVDPRLRLRDLVAAAGRGQAVATSVLDRDHVLLDQQRYAHRVLESESSAIASLKIDAAFHAAVELILSAIGMDGSRPAPQSGDAPPALPGHVGGQARGGSVVVGGVGKSGIIAQKISATFASLGAPSHFLHPTEALHGDLGRIRRGDVVLLLSYGGRTDEVIALATLLRQDSVPVIAMTAEAGCPLGRAAPVVLRLGMIEEASGSPAPTASTAAMLALGDALALCVSRRRSFGVDDFHRVHPGGSLGQLLRRVVDVMRIRVGENLPLVRIGQSVAQACTEAEGGALKGRRTGAMLVVDDEGRLAGIFTDGDLRRLLIREGVDGWQRSIERVMTPSPRRLTHDAKVRDAVQLAREHRIDEMPVVDANDRPIGLLDVQDLVGLKVIEV